MHARKSAVSAAVLVVLAPVKNGRIVFGQMRGLLVGILVASFLLCVTAAGASRPSAPSPQHTKADRAARGIRTRSSFSETVALPGMHPTRHTPPETRP